MIASISISTTPTTAPTTMMRRYSFVLNAQNFVRQSRQRYGER
jgi:hypothetical protein